MSKKIILESTTHARNAGMNKRKQCRLTLASGSTNARRAVFCSSQREGVAVFSVLMAQHLARPFSKEVVHVVRRSYHGIIS